MGLCTIRVATGPELPQVKGQLGTVCHWVVTPSGNASQGARRSATFGCWARDLRRMGFQMSVGGWGR